LARHTREPPNNWVITLDSSEEQHEEIIRAAIEKRAYAIFESRGSVHGFDLDDWITAKKEVLQGDPDPNTSDFRILIACPQDAGVTTILSLTSHSLIVLHASKRHKHEVQRGPEVFSVYVFPVEIVPAEVHVETIEGVLHVRLPKKNGERLPDQKR
jgi:hypothetical protein